MPLTKDQKDQIVEEVSNLLSSSKLTVIAKYQGTDVKQMQELRRNAKDSATSIKVVKNRLVKIAIGKDERFKDVDLSQVNGQLMYGFNAQDEVAPAQVIAKFAKTNRNVEFVGGLTADGQYIGPDDVNALANLPSKDQLRAQLVGTIAGPLSGFVGVLTGNVRSVLTVLNARAESIK